MGVGEAIDLSDASANWLPLDAEPLAHLMAQVGLVDVAGGLGVVVDRRVVEPGPAAVRPLGRVGDQDMGVELGISGARGAVEVAGGKEAIAVDELMPSRAAAGPAGFSLQVVQGRFDGGGVGGASLGPHLLAAERPEQGDRLGRGGGGIEAGNRAPARDLT